MRVHHLSCGTMRPAAVGGHLVCHCLLIETPKDGLVLVDAGLGTPDFADPAARLGKVFAKAVRPDKDPAQAAVARVKALGFDPRDVRHIVLTHMDLDHTGGLVDFPAARVHVHASEHAVAMARPDLKSRERYRPPMWAHQPEFATYSDLGEPWFGFDAVRGLRGLPPEILLIPTVGHTRGHTCVAVQSGAGWLVHAGDAYFDHGEVHARVRQCSIPLRIFQTLVEVDRKARLDNQDRLRELVHAHGDVHVFCAHDPSELPGAPAA
ncbi:MAG: MBL fold metallo-hydrolase [Myxococcota bacterium]